MAIPFTLIVMTFNRTEQLRHILEISKRYKGLQKAIIVWNNTEVEIPDLPDLPTLVLKMKKNSLNNKFLNISQFVETEAVVMFDDDLYLNPDDLDFLLTIWQANQERICGPNCRQYFVDESGEILYHFNIVKEYCFVLTNCCVFHRKYLNYYTEVDVQLLQLIDKNMNGEDLLFNFVVQKHAMKGPLWVFLDVQDLPTASSLCNQPDHFTTRAVLIKEFIAALGFPTKSNEMVVRADSLHLLEKKVDVAKQCELYKKNGLFKFDYTMPNSLLK